MIVLRKEQGGPSEFWSHVSRTDDSILPMDFVDEKQYMQCVCSTVGLLCKSSAHAQ